MADLPTHTSTTNTIKGLSTATTSSLTAYNVNTTATGLTSSTSTSLIASASASSAAGTSAGARSPNIQPPYDVMMTNASAQSVTGVTTVSFPVNDICTSVSGPKPGAGVDQLAAVHISKPFCFGSTDAKITSDVTAAPTIWNSKQVLLAPAKLTLGSGFGAQTEILSNQLTRKELISSVNVGQAITRFGLHLHDYTDDSLKSLGPPVVSAAADNYFGSHSTSDRLELNALQSTGAPFGTTGDAGSFGTSSSTAPSFGSTIGTGLFGTSSGTVPTFGETTSKTGLFSSSPNTEPNFGEMANCTGLLGTSSSRGSAFGSTTSNTTLFDTSSSTGLSFHGSTTSNAGLFGSSLTTKSAFGPSIPREAMKEYENKSMEEIRFEYLLNARCESFIDVEEFSKTQQGTCSKCHDKIDTVAVLSCFHMVCVHCLDQQNDLDIECQVCGKKTLTNDVSRRQISTDTQKCVNYVNCKLKQCATCGLENKGTYPLTLLHTASLYCLACKTYVCGREKCLELHQNHEIVSRTFHLANERQLLYCDAHKTEKPDIYCDDCSELICAKCKPNHVGHQIIPFAEAAEQLARLTSEKRLTAASVMQKMNDHVVATKAQLTETKRNFQTSENKICEKYTKLFNELWAEFQESLGAVQDEKKQVLEKQERQLHHLQFNSDCQNRIQQQTNPPSLDNNDEPIVKLKLLEDQTKALDVIAKQSCDFLPPSRDSTMSSITASEENATTFAEKLRKQPDVITPPTKPEMAASSAAEFRRKPDMRTPLPEPERATTSAGETQRKLERLALQKTKLAPALQFDLQYNSSKFTYMQNEIWFPQNTTNVVSIYDSAQPHKVPVKECTLKGVHEARSCVPLTPDDVIIAASNGMFCLQRKKSEQENVERFAEGNYSDVAYFESAIYALEDDKAQVHVFQRNATSNQAWKVQKIFPVPDYSANHQNALVVTSCGVYVSIWDRNEIQHFNLDISCYGPNSVEPIDFKNPVVCQALDDTVLVADSHNDRLVLLTPAGSVKQLSVGTQGRHPLWARVRDDDTMLVVFDNKSVAQYKL